MKTPLPEPSHYVYTTEDDDAKGEGCYTESQLRAAMVAAYNEAIENAANECEAIIDRHGKHPSPKYAEGWLAARCILELKEQA